MAEKYGLWIECPGKWNGWSGLAVGDTFMPITFDAAQAQRVVADIKTEGTYPGATVIEARPNPPERLPWNEAEWDRHHGRGEAR